jgi:hypothetical protein
MKAALSVVAACGILVAAAPVDQPRALVRPLPDALASRQVDGAAIAAITSGTMADLAQILAGHDISAGFVFTQDEQRRTEHALRRTGAMVTLGDVVARFNTAYPAYAAGAVAGVPFFGPDESECVRALGQMLSNVNIEDRLIWQAFADLALQFDPPADPGTPPGLVGSVLGTPGQPRPRRPTVWPQVTLRRGEVRLLDAYQAIVQQAPGFVWWIAEDTDRYPDRTACVVNKFHPGGALFSSHDVNAKGQASRTRT